MSSYIRQKIEDKMNSQDFGKRLKMCRESRKLSVKDVSRGIDVPVTTYREWEYGRTVQGIEPYLKLSAFFEMSLYELMSGQCSPQRAELMERVKFIEVELKKLKNMLNSF